MAEHSPFDVLEPMLATEGMENRARGHQLFFQPFTLTPESVAPLRARILDIVFREICSPDLRRAVRAADVLDDALRYPHGYFGQGVDDVLRDGWTPEFLATLDRLAELVTIQELDPVVTIAIRRAIQWHANHSPTDTRAAAQRTRDAIPEGPDQELALAMFDGWGHLSDEDFGHDYEAARRAREERADQLARLLIAEHDDQEVLRRLEDRLTAQAALSSTSGNPGPFVWALIVAKPSLGIGLVRAVAADPRSPLAQVLGVTIATITEQLPTESIPGIRTLVDTGDLSLRQQVANALGGNSASRSSLAPGELDLLLELATDNDEWVRRSVVRAAQRLAPHQPDAALILLVTVPFADSTAVADELFQTLGPHGGLDWRQLPDTQMTKFLDELEQCPSIEDYWIINFLADLSSERPDDLVRRLQRRVERAEANETEADYQPLPFGWTEDLRVRDTPQFLMILRRVREWMAENPGSWRRQHNGADLFAAVACAFDETVMAVLEEGAISGDDGSIVAVASILREAPPLFVFDEVPFVRRLLAAAAQHNQEHVRRIGGALSSAASGGVRSGIPGEPFAEDIEQRDRARKVADALPKGSLDEQLYRSLQTSAEERIRWQVDNDRDLADGRDW